MEVDCFGGAALGCGEIVANLSWALMLGRSSSSYCWWSWF